MPMLDVQKRQATVYRIRLGATVPTSGGKTRPVKLTEQIRVTSLNPKVIDEFIEVYGGERKAWSPDEHRNEWEVYLPTTSLKIVLLPGQALTQWWELWKGSVCERRCDGVKDTKSGKDCICPARDPAERTAARGQCNPVTRVHVICPDVKVIGAGMLISNGLIAAETLPEAIANADAALRLGYYVPATMTLVEHRGKNHFIVPRIETVGISMEQMMLEAAEGQGELMAASRTVLGGVHPRFTPMGELAAPAPSVRDQVGAVDGAAPPPRRGGAEPIPPTGLAPRPAADAGQGVAEPPDDDEIVDGEIVPDGNRIAPSTQSLAIKAREAGLDDDGRHDLAEWVTQGRSRSTRDLNDPERLRASDALERIKAGTARLERQDGAMQLLDARFGWKTDPPPAAEPAAERPAPAVGTHTAEEIAAMSGRELADALIALNESPAGKPEELRERLMGICGVGGDPF